MDTMLLIGMFVKFIHKHHQAVHNIPHFLFFKNKLFINYADTEKCSVSQKGAKCTLMGPSVR